MASQTPFFVEPDDPPSKQEIVKAALRLFVRDGVRESSVRAVAAEAGFSNPVLFKYFESKEALAVFLFERCYRRLAEEVAVAVRPGRSFDERLHELVDRVIGLYDEAPEALLFVSEELRRFWPLVSPPTRRQSVLRRTAGFFEEGIRAGEVTREVALPLLVAAFWGLLAQLCRSFYFREIPGRARESVPAIEALVRKTLAP